MMKSTAKLINFLRVELKKLHEQGFKSRLKAFIKKNILYGINLINSNPRLREQLIYLLYKFKLYNITLKFYLRFFQQKKSFFIKKKPHKPHYSPVNSAIDLESEVLSIEDDFLIQNNDSLDTLKLKKYIDLQLMILRKIAQKNND